MKDYSQQLWMIAFSAMVVAMCQYASCLGWQGNFINERGSYSKPVYVSPVR